MGFDFLKRRRHGVQPTAQLKKAPCLGLARKLPLHVCRIYVTSQQQAGLENRLIADDLHQSLEFHTHSLL